MRQLRHTTAPSGVNKVGSAWVKRISLVAFLFRRTLGRCTAHILVSLPLVVVEVGARYRRRRDARVLFAAEEVEALHRLFEEAVEEADGVERPLERHVGVVRLHELDHLEDPRDVRATGAGGPSEAG